MQMLPREQVTAAKKQRMQEHCCEAGSVYQLTHRSPSLLMRRAPTATTDVLRLGPAQMEME